MKIQLANKLLWKKLFESLRFYRSGPNTGASRSLLKHHSSPHLQKLVLGTGLKISARVAAVMLCSTGVWTEARAERFSINDAISQAVLTNPAVGEASANRGATEIELRRHKARLLPQVRLEARVGPEKFTQEITPPPSATAHSSTASQDPWWYGRFYLMALRQFTTSGDKRRI